MKIEKIRLHARHAPEDRSFWSMALILPRFSEEAAGYERLTAFYAALADAVQKRAAALSCAALSEMKVACVEDTFYSLVLDFLFYQGRDLIDCKRLTDTRRWDGIALPPPRPVKRQIPRNGGWYFDGEHYILYQNTFTPEEGVGVRRSAYGIFLPETVF